MSGALRVFKFGLAGVAGLIVDAGYLLVLVGPLGPIGGRAISFSLAVLTTWLINRNFAFGDKRSTLPLHIEFGRYLASMTVGGVANWCAYGLVLLLAPNVPALPLIGVVAGSIAGMGVNLFLAQRFVFR